MASLPESGLTLGGGARRITQVLALPALAVTVWWITSADSTSFFFPSLSLILERLVEWVPDALTTDIASSLRNLALGYVAACGAAIPAGIIVARYRSVMALTSPVIHFSRSIPPPALLPLFIAFLGIGPQMQTAFIAVGAFWPVLLSTIEGVEGIEPASIDVGRVFRLTATDRLFRITIPAASPSILAGMRTSLGIAVILVVISEMVAATSGFGYFIIASQRSFRTADMWAGILFVGAVGYVLSALLGVIEDRLLHWSGPSRGGVA